MIVGLAILIFEINFSVFFLTHHEMPQNLMSSLRGALQTHASYQSHFYQEFDTGHAVWNTIVLRHVTNFTSYIDGVSIQILSQYSNTSTGRSDQS